MLALALDMGGTHIGCGILDDETLLRSSSLDSQRAESLSSLLPCIESALRDLLKQTGVSAEQCAGLAIGFPGIVDVREGKILSTLKKYEDAIELDLERWARDRFGLRLRMENDARMALLGEQYAGAARDSRDLVMITLGTGIGGAAMIMGKLLRGAHAQAGCLGGHLPVDFRGHPCTCGNIGCAEAEAAGWSLPRIAREMPGFEGSRLSSLSDLDFRALFEWADCGDDVARSVREHCLRVWAANAVALIHAYDPEVVVIGGGVMQSASVILRFVQEYVEKHAWTCWGTPKVRAAKLGGNAALHGATPLLSENLHP